MKNNIDEILKEKWTRRLKGYTSIPRVNFLYLSKGLLTDQELILFLLLTLVVMDWDHNHATYETFVYDERQISLYTGWSFRKTYRIFSSLVRKGHVELMDKKAKIYTLHYPKARKVEHEKE